MSTAHILPVFPTLRSVGYTECAHPRHEDGACCDCGAVNHDGHWVGGTLDYRRRPMRYQTA